MKSKTITKLCDRLSKGKSGYFLTYTAVFAVIALAVFSVFILKGKGFVWISTGGGKDGYQQHFIAFMYLGQWLREIAGTLLTEGRLEIPMWDFSIGYGSDVITTMNYYAFGDPLNLLSAFVPSRYSEYAYTFVAILRMYLSGIAFSLYSFKMNNGKTATLAGAIAYTFSGYALFNVARHVFFMNVMIYLPLMLLGAEKIFRKEKPLLFIFMVFIASVSNFYFLYMAAIMVALYVVIRYFTMEREKSLKDFFLNIAKFAGGGLLGVGMAGFIFVPVVNLFLSSPRTGETGGVLELLYNTAHYERMYAGIFAGNNLSYYTCLAFGAPLFVAIVVMFTSRKKYTGLKIATVALGVMVLFPIFGRILNGFSYASNRWTFAIAWLMAFVLTTVWEDILSITPKKLIAVSACWFLYSASLLLIKDRITKATFVSVMLIFVTVLLLIIARKIVFIKESKRVVAIALVGILGLSLCANGYFTYTQGEEPYITEFLDRGKAYKGIARSSDKVASKLTEEETFARNEQNGVSVLNASTVTEATGLQYYWSLENGIVSGFLMENALNAMMPQMYSGVDGRIFLEKLASVKYFVRGGSDPVPYGYQQIDTVEKGGKTYEIYESKNTLPLGYTYWSFISKEAYENMSAAEKQQAMLQGVVLEETPTDFSETQLKYNHQVMKTKITFDESIVVQKDGSLVVNEKEAEMTIEFDGLENCETYLSFEGLKAQSRNKYELYMDDCQEKFSMEKFENLPEEEQQKLKEKDKNQNKSSKEYAKHPITVISENAKNKLACFQQSYKYYTGQEDFLMNMGYSQKAQNKMVVIFPNTGVYKFDKMEVICQPMTRLDSQLNALKEDVLEDVEIGTNSVNGNISLNQDKILCLSIPYNIGWSAKVDGEKVDLLRANSMYMAIPLTAGQHKIELAYTTPMLKTGIVLSIISFGIFIAMAIVYIKRKPSQ